MRGASCRHALPLLACAFAISLAQAGVPEPSAARSSEYAPALVKSWQQPPRRLFGVDIGWIWNKLTGTGQATTEFVTDAAEEFADVAVASLGAIVGSFSDAQALMDAAIRAAENLLQHTQAFAAGLHDLFNQFSPLTQTFESRYGMLVLATGKEKLKTLVEFVLQLSEASGDVTNISDAFAKVQTIFMNLYDVMYMELSKLPNPGGRRLDEVGFGGRRLQGMTQLLDGLRFDELNRTFSQMSSRAREIGDNLRTINATLHPLLQRLESALSRRLIDEDDEQASRRLGVSDAMRARIDEIRLDYAEYQAAVTGIMPTWTATEKVVSQACTTANEAIGQVRSLQCRVRNFIQFPSIPGAGQVNDLIGRCDEESMNGDVQSGCPTTFYSESVNDALSANAFYIGSLCAGFDYFFTYDNESRWLLSVVFLVIPGVLLGAFGYRWKDVEFWIEGFVSGFVLFSILVSCIIVWFGVCQDTLITSCSPTGVGVVVTILSVGWAFLVVQGEQCHLFFAGFDLGAVMGAVLYFIQEHETIVYGLMDPEVAKEEMLYLLLFAALSGVVMGCIILYLERFAIVLGTSFIGSGLITMAFIIIRADRLRLWIGLLLLLGTGVFMLIQYRYTNPKRKGGICDEVESEDEAEDFLPIMPERPPSSWKLAY